MTHREFQAGNDPEENALHIEIAGVLAYMRQAVRYFEDGLKKAELSSKGGRAKSAAKTATAKRNGRKGGRPKSKKPIAT